MLKISMSGYYSYLRGKETKNKAEEKYREKIREIFDEGRGTYGVDRVCGLLRKRGSTASYDRVKGMMQEMGLFSIHRSVCNWGQTYTIDRKVPVWVISTKRG